MRFLYRGSGVITVKAVDILDSALNENSTSYFGGGRVVRIQSRRGDLNPGPADYEEGRQCGLLVLSMLLSLRQQPRGDILTLQAFRNDALQMSRYHMSVNLSCRNILMP